MTLSSLPGLPSWTRRPAGAAAIVALFVSVALLLLPALRPWYTLDFSTWPSGYEAGRIARNLDSGLGYMSPFVALPGDNFLASEPGSPHSGTAEPAVQEAGPGRWPTAWITPPYVLMWYLPFLLFGAYTTASVAAFQTLQIALMGLALWLAWALARRAYGEGPAALALIFLVLYPSTWYFALEDTHGTSLFVVLLLATLLTLGRLFDATAGKGDVASDSKDVPPPGLLAAHGLSVAFALLTEPSSLLFFGWLEVWAARRLGRRGRRLLVMTAAACLLVLGPWFARNLATLRSPVLFKSNLPMELFYGNNDEAPGDAFLAHIHRFPAWTEDERLRLLEIGEPAYARLCLERAVQFMRAHPIATLVLTVKRIVYYWSFNPDRVQPWRPLLTLIFILVLGLWCFATAALGWRRLVWLDRACIGFFALFPVAYYATQFMIYRYRYPVEALLLIAAASALARSVGGAVPGSSAGDVAAGGPALSAARESLPGSARAGSASGR